MQRIAFPRLYVPPPETPELPRVTVVYHGKRSPFGPVTVYCVAETREVASHKDWRGDEAVDLARDLFHAEMLRHDDQEQNEAFAREVLATLPADSWELSMREVCAWYRRWRDRVEKARCNYPPTSDPDDELPGPEDEARMLELVKRLGRES